MPDVQWSPACPPGAHHPLHGTADTPNARLTLRARRQTAGRYTMTNIRSHSVATTPSSSRLAAALAGPRRQTAHLDGQFERVAGADLAAETGAVETAEQRQLAGIALVGEHGDRADLGDGLAHQHAGQRRAAGEVAGEEPLLPRQMPATGGADTGRDRDDLVDEQERWAVREDVRRRGEAHDRASAPSRLVGVSFGLIFGQACSTVPVSSIRNALRCTPMYVLP